MRSSIGWSCSLRIVQHGAPLRTGRFVLVAARLNQRAGATSSHCGSLSTEQGALLDGIAGCRHCSGTLVHSDSERSAGAVRCQARPRRYRTNRGPTPHAHTDVHGYRAGVSVLTQSADEAWVRSLVRYRTTRGARSPADEFGLEARGRRGSPCSSAVATGCARAKARTIEGVGSRIPEREVRPPLEFQTRIPRSGRRSFSRTTR